MRLTREVRAFAAACLVVSLVGLAWVPRTAAGPVGVPISWGEDGQGQLGDDANLANKSTPVNVAGLANMVGIASGHNHSFAWNAAGQVFGWGNNNNGQLGNNTDSNQFPTPTAAATGLTNVVQMAGGSVHSLARTADGRVYGMGFNFFGQVGDGVGGAVNVKVPTQVQGLPNPATNPAVWIICGTDSSAALMQDGTVYAWGGNFAGQLGNGTTDANPHPTAAQVPGLTGVVAIAGRGNHILALRSNGALVAWGQNAKGELGNGNTTTQPSPVAVGGLAGLTIVQIATGLSHSLVRLSDNTIRVWGNNTNGQLGIGAADPNPHSSPVAVPGLSNVVFVGAGHDHTFAILGDATMRSWGLNSSGQLGNGNTTQQPAPVAVNAAANGSTVVTGGALHSVALAQPVAPTPTATSTGVATSTPTATATTQPGASPTATATTQPGASPTATATTQPGAPTPTPVIPEPSPLLLFGSGLAALAVLLGAARRRR